MIEIINPENEQVWLEARLGKQLAGTLGLCATLIAQVDVHPSGEEVFLVPNAVAVAQQNQGVSHGLILARGYAQTPRQHHPRHD